MIGPAQRVGDAVFTAMPHEQHARVVDWAPTFGARTEVVRLRRMPCQDASLPVRPLHRPRDDVLQTTEDSESLASLLRDPIALVRLDRDSTPTAALMRHARSVLVQDPLQLPRRAFPVVAGNSSQAPARPPAPWRSIRGPQYLHEHMFPFRPSRTAATLLELADALLAPSEPATRSGDRAVATGEQARCSPPHPHRRTVSRKARRRPAPQTRPQPCLTPLSHSARRSDAPAPRTTQTG